MLVKKALIVSKSLSCNYASDRIGKNFFTIQKLHIYIKSQANDQRDDSQREGGRQLVAY